MGLIREPLDVDFYVDSRPLTNEEREKISQHIREYKLKMAKQKNRKASSKGKAIGHQPSAIRRKPIPSKFPPDSRS